MGDDHLFVSRHILREIGDLLDEVPGLIEDLEIAIVKLDHIGRGMFDGLPGKWHKKPSEFPIPFSVDAYDARDKLHNELVGWVRMVCESRAIEDYPKNTTPAVAKWLRDHLMSLGMTEGAHDALAGIGGVVDAVRWIVCPPKRVASEREIRRTDNVRLNARGVAALARILYEAGDDRCAGLNKRRVLHLREMKYLNTAPGPWHPQFPLQFYVGEVLKSHFVALAKEESQRQNVSA